MIMDNLWLTILALIVSRWGQHSYVSNRDDAELTKTFKIRMSRDGEVCTLQMSGVTQKMSGEYRCVAVNTFGEAVCAAKVTIMGTTFDILDTFDSLPNRNLCEV